MPALGDDVWAVAVVIAVDAVLYVVGRKIITSDTAQSARGISLPLSLGITATALLMHLTAVGLAAGLAGAFGDPGASLSYLGISIITGAAPTIIFAHMIMQSTANLGNALIVGEEKDALERFDRTKALALLKEGKVEAAMAEYGLQARAFPESPEPLTALAILQEHQGQLDEAAATWREARGRFPHDPGVQKQVKSHLAYIGRTLTRQRDGHGVVDLVQGENFDYNAPETMQAAGNAPSSTTPETPHVPDTMEGARRQARRGDTDHAIRVCREYYRSLEEPNSQPLFAIATALQKAERHDEAKAVLQEIGRTFNGDGRTWAKAMFALVSILEQSEFDRSGARYILNQIQERMPGSEQAMMAGEKLGEMVKGA